MSQKNIEGFINAFNSGAAKAASKYLKSVRTATKSPRTRKRHRCKYAKKQ